MDFFKGIGYAFVNGFIYLGDLFAQNWWWVFGVIGLALIYVAECKEIGENYVDHERQIM
jgi:hypothetical protein